MHYYTIQPSEQLKPYVRCFWVLEHELGEGESYVYRSIADGCAEMVFHYQTNFDEISGDNRQETSLSGMQFQTTHYRRFVAKASFGIFGAYIYPFAVPYFFKVPASETSNLALDYDTFLGYCGQELEERIMLAADNNERAKILDLFLRNRLGNTPLKDDRIITSIRRLIHSNINPTVSQLADTYNLSVRQFDRKFKEYAGFSPKTYLRLVRLHKATQQYGTNKPLTQIAYECGYYDQSHFIHDLKAFTGYHPSFYFSGNAEGTEYRNV